MVLVNCIDCARVTVLISCRDSASEQNINIEISEN